jgi:hypothetical protein
MACKTRFADMGYGVCGYGCVVATIKTRSE